MGRFGGYEGRRSVNRVADQIMAAHAHAARIRERNSQRLEHENELVLTYDDLIELELARLANGAEEYSE